MSMKLSDYPIGSLAYFAGLDVDGRVVKSNQLIPHSHDTTYSGINHNHDTIYSAIGHNHDGDYSAIGHNHDSDYASRAELGRVFSASWAGGQALPYRVLIAARRLESAYFPNLFGFIMRDDGYMYYFRADSLEYYNIPSHVASAYNIARELDGENTYIVIPSGAASLNVAGRTYSGSIIG